MYKTLKNNNSIKIKNIAKNTLRHAIENLEKTQGQYFGFLKTYIYYYENNNEIINSKLKEIIISLEKQLKENNQSKINTLGEIINILENKTFNENINGKDIYLNLVKTLNKHDFQKIKELINKISVSNQKYLSLKEKIF